MPPPGAICHLCVFAHSFCYRVISKQPDSTHGSIRTSKKHCNFVSSQPHISATHECHTSQISAKVPHGPSQPPIARVKQRFGSKLKISRSGVLKGAKNWPISDFGGNGKLGFAYCEG